MNQCQTYTECNNAKITTKPHLISSVDAIILKTKPFTRSCALPRSLCALLKPVKIGLMFSTKNYALIGIEPCNKATHAKFTAQHFVASVLRTPRNTSSTPTTTTFIGVNPQNLSGLNSLGIMLDRTEIQ